MKRQNGMVSRGNSGFWRGWRATLTGVLVSIAAASGAAHAQVAPFEVVATLSKDVVPVERSFEIPQAGAGQYRITLTDVGALFTTPSPAPLESMKLVITRGQTVVTTLDANDPDSDPDHEPVDTALFDATPGTYVVHVVGKPGDVTGSGPFSLSIENTTSNASVLALSGTLSPPETVRQDVRSYQTEIDVPAGTYQLTLADLQFPRALQSSGVFVFQAGASALTACLVAPETPATTLSGCSSTKTVTLTAGKYIVVAAGALPSDDESTPDVDETSDAGAFAVHMFSTTDGSIIHSRTVEIGRLTRMSSESFRLNAGAHTLELKDFEYPAALSAGSVLVTRAAQATAVATLAAPSAPFTVPADSTAYDVFAYNEPDATAGVGSFQVDVRKDSGGVALSSVQVVAGASSGLVAYAYPVDVPAAGAYRAKLGDFQFPAALSSTRVAIVQNGAIVGKTTDPGPTLTLDLPSVAVGSATVIAIVKPASGANVQQSGGAFGLELTSTANSEMVLDVAQGIGPLVSVRKVSVTQAGKYDLTLTDLAFPEVFHDLMAVISRGSQRLGTLIVGSGTSGGTGSQGGSATLLDFDASVSNYSLTVISQPSDTEHAATYGLSFTNAPAGPTITLSSDSQAVTSGNTAKLTWSTQGATTCTASSVPAGAWTGSKAVSGSENTVALTSATTFKLTCTGAGGRSAEQSVNVIIAAASTGSGGGGSLDWAALAGLAACLGLALARRRIPGRRLLSI